MTFIDKSICFSFTLTLLLSSWGGPVQSATQNPPLMQRDDVILIKNAIMAEKNSGNFSTRRTALYEQFLLPELEQYEKTAIQETPTKFKRKLICTANGGSEEFEIGSGTLLGRHELGPLKYLPHLELEKYPELNLIHGYFIQNNLGELIYQDLSSRGSNFEGMDLRHDVNAVTGAVNASKINVIQGGRLIVGGITLDCHPNLHLNPSNVECAKNDPARDLYVALGKNRSLVNFAFNMKQKDSQSPYPAWIKALSFAKLSLSEKLNDKSDTEEAKSLTELNNLSLYLWHSVYNPNEKELFIREYKNAYGKNADPKIMDKAFMALSIKKLAHEWKRDIIIQEVKTKLPQDPKEMATSLSRPPEIAVVSTEWYTSQDYKKTLQQNYHGNNGTLKTKDDLILPSSQYPTNRIGDHKLRHEGWFKSIRSVKRPLIIRKYSGNPERWLAINWDELKNSLDKNSIDHVSHHTHEDPI